MKKKIGYLAIATAIAASTVLPMQAIAAVPDPDAMVSAFFSSDGMIPTHRKALTRGDSSNDKLDYLNLHCTLRDTDGKLKGSEVGTQQAGEPRVQVACGTTPFQEAYTVQGAARSYYTDGTSSSVIYASATNQ